MVRKKDCTMWFVMDIIGQKWNIPIILELINAIQSEKNTLNYTDLKNLIPDISTKVLAMRLKYLTNEGVIDRVDNELTPKKVRYRLSQSGRDLIPILEDLRKWSVKYGDCDNQTCIMGLCRHAITLEAVLK